MLSITLSISVSKKKQGHSAEKSKYILQYQKSALIQYCDLIHRLHLSIPGCSNTFLYNHPFLLSPESSPGCSIVLNFHVSISTSMWSSSLVFPCLLLLNTFEEYGPTLLNDLQFAVGWYFLKLTFRLCVLDKNNTEGTLCSRQITLGAYCVSLYHGSWCWLIIWLRGFIIKYFVNN